MARLVRAFCFMALPRAAWWGFVVCSLGVRGGWRDGPMVGVRAGGVGDWLVLTGCPAVVMGQEGGRAGQEGR